MRLGTDELLTRLRRSRDGSGVRILAEATGQQPIANSAAYPAAQMEMKKYTAYLQPKFSHARPT